MNKSEGKWRTRQKGQETKSGYKSRMHKAQNVTPSTPSHWLEVGLGHKYGSHSDSHKAYEETRRPSSTKGNSKAGWV